MTIFKIERTVDGLFSALFTSFTDKVIPDIILSGSLAKQKTNALITEITTDYDNSARVGRAIKKYGKDELILKLKNCIMSDDESALTVAFYVAYMTLFYRKDLSKNTEIEKISKFVYIEDKVAREKYRLIKTLKFYETDGGVLYAPLYPEADVTDCIAEYFYKKYQTLPFVLHDVKRGRVVASNGYTLHFTDTAVKVNLLNQTDQRQFDELWKSCYREILLKEKRKIKIKPYPIR